MKLFNHLDKFRKNNLTLVPFLVGDTGIGKTTLSKAYAKHSSMKFLVMNLSAVDSTDFTGRQIVRNDITHWAKPDWLNVKNTVILLDETNRITDLSVKGCLHSLLTDRKINGHILDDSNFIMTAGNIGEKFEVFDFDRSLSDRLATITVEITPKDVHEYLSQCYSGTFLDFYYIHSEECSASPRRIEEFLKTDCYDKDFMKIFFDSATLVAFRKYEENTLADFNSVVQGKFKDNIPVTQQTNILKKIAKDTFVGILTNEYDKNLRKFFDSCGEEARSMFFKEVMKLITSKPDSAKFRDEYLKTHEVFFKGMGDQIKQFNGSV